MAKRKLVLALNFVLIIIIVKILSNYMINSSLIINYNNGKYLEKQAKVLKVLNFFEAYIADYNYGNILYQNGKYEDAIIQYENALKKHIPKRKECNIRINYALSICRTAQVDENNEESIRSAIKNYEKAIDVLTEVGCANKDDSNGHSEKAETLKNDIQKEIDRLKKLLKEDNNNENEKENNENEEKNEEYEKQIEEKIQNIKEEAIKDQRELETTLNNYNKQYVINEKNW